MSICLYVQQVTIGFFNLELITISITKYRNPSLVNVYNGTDLLCAVFGPNTKHATTDLLLLLDKL